MKKILYRKEEFYGYEKRKEIFSLFSDLKDNYPDNFYLLFYDDLLHDVKLKVEKLFKFCELKIQQQALDFIQGSTSIEKEDTYSVFKKKDKDNAWKLHLNPKIIKEIEQDLQKSNLIEFTTK